MPLKGEDPSLCIFLCGWAAIRRIQKFAWFFEVPLFEGILVRVRISSLLRIVGSVIKCCRRYYSIHIIFYCSLLYYVVLDLYSLLTLSIYWHQELIINVLYCFDLLCTVSVVLVIFVNTKLSDYILTCLMVKWIQALGVARWNSAVGTEENHWSI